MYVGLPHNFKGTHMSRFVEILNSHERAISVETSRPCCRTCWSAWKRRERPHRDERPYFINKTAPVSGVQSLLDYDVTFIGDIINGKIQVATKVVVPVTSLCPCSEKNLRPWRPQPALEHVTVTARTNEFMWIEEIVQLVEAEVSVSCSAYSSARMKNCH